MNSACTRAGCQEVRLLLQVRSLLLFVVGGGVGGGGRGCINEPALMAVVKGWGRGGRVDQFGGGGGGGEVPAVCVKGREGGGTSTDQLVPHAHDCLLSCAPCSLNQSDVRPCSSVYTVQGEVAHMPCPAAL